jgi:hypothetical protein
MPAAIRIRVNINSRTLAGNLGSPPCFSGHWLDLTIDCVLEFFYEDDMLPFPSTISLFFGCVISIRRVQVECPERWARTTCIALNIPLSRHKTSS